MIFFWFSSLAFLWPHTGWWSWLHVHWLRTRVPCWVDHRPVLQDTWRILYIAKKRFLHGRVCISIFGMDLKFSIRLISCPYGISSGQTQNVMRTASRGSFRQHHIQPVIMSKTKKELDRDHWPFLFLLLHSVQELVMRFPSYFQFTTEYLILMMDTFSASHVCKLSC